MTVKVLSGRELAGFVKERQAHVVRGMRRVPTLLIIRDSDDPVIARYVRLKMRYGADIGVKVLDYMATDGATIAERIKAANSDGEIDSIILQLPIRAREQTDELCDLIAPEKDVDGLGKNAKYDSATATAILWLLAGYDIDLSKRNIAIVGRGKLVGAPLFQMMQASNYRVEQFHRGDDLTKLKRYDTIISATGVPRLVVDEFVSPATVLVDAGTASEKGVIMGDLAPELYERRDIAAITPVQGGVGPLTVACLFEHVIQAAS